MGVDDFFNSIGEKAEGIAKKAKDVAGYIKEDVGDLIDTLIETPEEIEKEKAEERAKKEKEEKEKAEKEAAEKAEKERMEQLQKSYILHTAMITCSFSMNVSFVVLPVSHGEFIQGMPQLNIEDSKPNINIRTFGVCMSPHNPAVMEAAKKVLEAANKERKKTFSEKVMDIFTGGSNDEVVEKEAESLASQCAAPCTPMIFTKWVDGNKGVLVNGQAALMGRCKLMCIYGGEIKPYTSGQQRE